MSAHNRYVIALGSNLRHVQHGSPRRVLAAALEVLAAEGIAVVRASRTLTTLPLGPSRRCYANGAALIETALEPEELLALCQQVEALFGRHRRGGQAWSARVLDLDIVLWSGGAWASRALIVPHPHFRTRDFVLRPACEVAPRWRDPLSGLGLRPLFARLTKPVPIPR